MDRRQYIGCVAVMGTTAIAGCGGGGGSDNSSDGGGDGGNSNWDFEDTFTTTGNIEEERIGELEEGDEVEFEIEVIEGRSVRAEILNQDTGEIAFSRFVYRDEQMEGYNESNTEEAASPFNTTIQIQEFGEYYGRLAMIPDNLEVVMRFRVL
ncbi:hypothetical protein EGH22_20480 [Halomicroarcula sp. F28]|uniref:hypothetical protein n=1 Tax=Haloarcula salinisoli TaxID=2487746 RepID=UPI001C73D4DF|nr:hypothetical protein [Halomicroarcula salinisoli]MBX0288711.1 hypothetical protein [Halomicroarcula salinisoli]